MEEVDVIRPETSGSGSSRSEATVRPGVKTPGVEEPSSVPRLALSERFRRLARREPLRSAPNPGLQPWRINGPTDLAPEDARRVDRVLRLAIRQQLIPATLVQDGLSQIIKESSLAWRDLAEMYPETRPALQRLAADVYGFRSVLICQMSSLVLADLLTCRIPPHMWRPMFEAGLVPVVEHGTEPDPNGRVVCISSDPSSKEVREFLETVKAIRPEVAYSDPSHVRVMMDLIAQHVPTVGAQVSMLLPETARIKVADSPKRAA